MHKYLRWILKKFTRSLLQIILALIIFNIGNPAIAQNPPNAGEQLFAPCKACHTLGKGKLIGPDLYGVTKRLDKDWITRFVRNSQAVIQSKDPEAVKVWEEHNKIPMPPFNYTDEQMASLLEYIGSIDTTKVVSQVATKGVTEGAKISPAPGFFSDTGSVSRNYGTTFFIALVLLLIALLDLTLTKIIKARLVHIIVILISLGIMTEILVVESMNLGRQPNYEPDQPILFSHKIHADQNQIDCKYCHFAVLESKNAGIPPVALCMNCHNVVKEGTHTGTTEIAKIYKAIETSKPIQWIRVHNLPDFVYFSHAQHVNAGKLECALCHGDVKSRDRIRQNQALSMGWCIECHRSTGVNFAGNKFYSKYTALQEQVKSGMKSMVTVEEIGGTDCSECHY